MNRRDFLKKGISATAGIIAYSALVNLCDGKEIVSSQSTNPYNTNANKYATIEWIFYKDDERIIHGVNPDAQSIKKLEEVVCTDKDTRKIDPAYLEPIFADKEPKEIEPTIWDITALAKLVPVKRLIEQHSQHYSINPMWATMFLTYESLLKPADYNEKSNDFGIGQVKLKDEKLAKTLGTNPKNKLYSPYLKKEGLVFDPETNIIMAMFLQRYNIETMHLKNSDQVYAFYAGGKPGLTTFTKKPSRATRKKVASIHERYLDYENVIPLFRLGKNEVASIENPDTRFLLELYHSGLETKDMYKKELDYFLGSLEQNLAGDARSWLVYDDCVTFKKALEIVWKDNQRGIHENLLEIGSKLSKLVSGNAELKDKVDKSIGVLKQREIKLDYSEKKKWFFF